MKPFQINQNKKIKNTEWNEEQINIASILRFIDEVKGNVLIAGEENVR